MIYAIHFDALHLRIAQLQKGKIVSLRSIPIGEEVRIPRSSHIVSALSATECLLRVIELPASANRHRKQIIDFQAKSATHLPEDEIHWATQWISAKDAIQLSLFLTQSSLLSRLLERLELLGVIPDQISAISAALWRYVQWKDPSFGDGWILDARNDAWLCIEIKDRKITQAHSLSSREREASLQRLIPHPNAIFCTGDAKERVRIAHILQGADVRDYGKPLAREEKLFAVAIGLTLDADRDGVQFLTGQWTPSHHLQKLGRKGIWVASILFCLNGLALFSGNQFLSREEDSLQKKLNNFLEKAPAELQQQIAPAEPGWEARWPEILETCRDRSVYFPKIPSAEATLEWLTKHPLWDFSFISFRYSLPEIPTPATQALPARVDLEFQTDHALRAHQFHKALLQSEGIIPEELKLESSSNLYHLSFLLRSLP